MYSQTNQTSKQLPFQLMPDPIFTQRAMNANPDNSSSLLFPNIFESLVPQVRKQDTRLNETMPTVSKCPNTELYKTELCRYWCAGLPCKFGNGCWFAHGPEELQIAQFVVPAKNPGLNSLDYEVRNNSVSGSSSNSLYQKMQDFHMQENGKLVKGSEIKNNGLVVNGNFLLDSLPLVSTKSNNGVPSTPTSRFPKVPVFSRAVGYEREIKNGKQELKADDSLLTFKNFELLAQNFWDSGISSSRRSSNGSTAASSDKELISPPFAFDNTSIFHSPMSSGSNENCQQNNSDTKEPCDMYRWCGFCYMGSACPFVHSF